MSVAVPDILFLLLRVALRGDERECSQAKTVDWDMVDWQGVYDLAKSQGVAAIAFDGVVTLHKHSPNLELRVPRLLKMRWVAISDSIEKNSDRQFVRSAELASLYGAEGIDVYVLKGFALSDYYPIPKHRECGDLDCFLGEDYERGNVLAEQNGADVSRGFYKHSHIEFRGLTVENHQFCTAIRGARRRKRFERHLQGLLKEATPEYISGTKLIRPSADFNALFLTAHSFGHFLTEGIKIRHILDWALLVQAEQTRIDWEEFYRQCDAMGYTRFAEALTAIAVEYLGFKFTNPAIRQRSAYAKRVLNDILYYGHVLHTSHYSKLRKRFLIVEYNLRGAWKYHKLYGRSVLFEVARANWALCFERHPKL